MTFLPDSVPDQQLDDSASYAADVPFDLKQASRLSSQRHRWFWPQVIGTPSGPYSTSRGLNAGATMRIQFDQKPDYIVIAVSGETAVTGRVNVYLGDPGGPYITVGPSGYVTIPAPQGGIVTLVNVGTTPTFGVVVAVAGFADPGITINPGN